jgi:ferredoxin-NADP reductase/predicted pyridoxine 5'-phosphate oxidase superfamily flavin-nucleotide-binding protein
MERFGRQVIQDHLPDQHREFYQQLPFVLVGHADQSGWPWASILFNPPGFMSSPSPDQLHVDARPIIGDPLADSIAPGERLGMLGIEFQSRRRNRLAGHVSAVSDSGFELVVDQAFGNCPQYIQTRALEFVTPVERQGNGFDALQGLTDRAREIIQAADTFFVASYVAEGTGAASEGVDISHRGGRPGFVRIDDANTLTIPDYLGNNHFNTLGNFLVNSRAGLLFADFDSGDMLMLTGHAEILWDDPDAEYFEGAERLWRFRLDHGRYLPDAMPVRWSFGDYSPNTLMTGTWDEAAAQHEAQSTRQQWRELSIVRIEDESDQIRSFYLEPVEGVLPTFQAGQFLTVKLQVGGQDLIRTYTLSSAPADTLYRISVKRELAASSDGRAGRVSGYLHDHVKVGDSLMAKAPLGGFTLDTSETRPVVLLSGGVGITPMVSMLRHALHEGVRTRHMRELVFIHAASNASERPFFSEVSAMTGRSGGAISYHSALSHVDDSLTRGQDFHHAGRITSEFLQSVLPAEDCDYYLCGPPAFMQGMYDLLRSLDVRDQQILAEAFGPASLKREPDAGTSSDMQLQAADEAIVEFEDSRFQQSWTPQSGSLLELAEAHGLTPAYGCRSGQCGACKVQLLDGQVAYQYKPDVVLEEGEVLLCCCVPAKTPDGQMARVSLAI